MIRKRYPRSTQESSKNIQAFKQCEGESKNQEPRTKINPIKPIIDQNAVATKTIGGHVAVSEQTLKRQKETK